MSYTRSDIEKIVAKVCINGVVVYDNFPWLVTAACAHVQQFQG